MRLTDFRVKGFKSFAREVVLEELGPINVLHGANNVGKSNLVEAIGLYFQLMQETLGWSARQEPRAAISSDSGPGENFADESDDDEDMPALPSRRTRRIYEPEQSLAMDESGLFIKRRQVSAARFARAGYPPHEIFHLFSPGPIAIAGTLALSPQELEGIDAPFPISPVHIAFTLAKMGEHLEITVRELSLVGADAIRELAAEPEYRRLLRQLVVLLGSGTVSHEQAPHFALLTVTRSITPAQAIVRSEPLLEGLEPRGRSLIPDDLCLALYDAKESTEPALHRRWKRFVSLLQRFEDILGPGTFNVTYDRHEEVAHLVFEGAQGRVPARLLGSGVQQIASLLGRMLMSRASIVAIEEPELNLRHTLQQRLRDILEALVREDDSEVGQIILTSHTLAFESGDCFYGMRMVDGAPRIERRPVAEAAAFIEQAVASVPPSNKRAPLCYVSSEGLVLLPHDVRERLGVVNGGGVFFVDRKDTGHTEILSNEQFFELVTLARNGEHDSE